MLEKLNLLRCNICYNIVQIAEVGAGDLVCCNEAMEVLKEREVSKDDAHFANIEKISENEYKIYFNHEMKQEHYIQFVEVISNDNKFLKRKYFEAGNLPELNLKCNCDNGFYVRVYCNIHNVCATKAIEVQNG